MSLTADKKYDGTVGAGSYLSYSANGNLAFNVAIDYDDGTTFYAIWLTEKNREKAIKMMEFLGADTSKLGSETYLDMELANVISGKEISFGTKEDTYNGKTSVKVSWIGKRTDPNIARGAASFFGGKSAPKPDAQSTFSDGRPIDDSDVPF